MLPTCRSTISRLGRPSSLLSAACSSRLRDGIYPGVSAEASVCWLRGGHHDIYPLKKHAWLARWHLRFTHSSTASSVETTSSSSPFSLGPAATSKISDSFSAVPGRLDLSVPGASRLQSSVLHEEIQRVLLSISRSIAGFFNHPNATESIDAGHMAQALASLQDPRRLDEIWATENLASRRLLAQAIFTKLLDEPELVCQTLPKLHSDSSVVRLSTSIQLIQCLYHHFLLEGLESATIAPVFYDTLISLMQAQGSDWSDRVLSSIPRYYLHERCPKHLRAPFEALTKPSSAHRHFEDDLIEVHMHARQGMIAEAFSCLPKLQPSSTIYDTVEYYNAFCIMLDAAGSHLPAEELNVLLQPLVDDEKLLSPMLWSILMSFVAKFGLKDLMESLDQKIKHRPHHPALDIQKLQAQRSMAIYDTREGASPSEHYLSEHKENLYALSSILRNIEAVYRPTGRQTLTQQLLEALQRHANVEFLVQLGIASHVESKHRPYIDGPLASIIMRRYFSEMSFQDHAVIPVYNNFKRICQTLNQEEFFRVAAFPNAMAYNAFIFAFSKMSKDHLGDALDVLAELTRNHDPIANRPQSIPASMAFPNSLSTGPDASTHAYLIRAFTRHGQLQAAERCLAELWRKWPESWEGSCDILIRAYLSLGMIDEAGTLLTRKVNAGYEIDPQSLSRAFSAASR